jgi:hypothetical protein
MARWFSEATENKKSWMFNMKSRLLHGPTSKRVLLKFATVCCPPPLLCLYSCCEYVNSVINAAAPQYSPRFSHISRIYRYENLGAPVEIYSLDISPLLCIIKRWKCIIKKSVVESTVNLGMGYKRSIKLEFNGIPSCCNSELQQAQLSASDGKPRAILTKCGNAL